MATARRADFVEERPELGAGADPADRPRDVRVSSNTASQPRVTATSSPRTTVIVTWSAFGALEVAQLAEPDQGRAGAVDEVGERGSWHTNA